MKKIKNKNKNLKDEVKILKKGMEEDKEAQRKLKETKTSASRLQEEIEKLHKSEVDLKIVNTKIWYY